MLLSIKKTEIRILYLYCEKGEKFNFKLSKIEKLKTEIVRFRNLVWRRKMNVISQSASRAEADSYDDSALSLSLFREGSDRTIIFWPNLELVQA